MSAGCIKRTINASPELRWWLFARFGADQICPEMLRRSAPLRLAADGPVIGRFFPNQCQTHLDDAAQTVTLRFGGTGYAWTPVAGRIGFSASGAVEYRMDFRFADDVIYVWGRPVRITEPVVFQVGSVENPWVNAAQQSPLGLLSSLFGRQLVESQLSAGFTVVHSDKGDAFALGVLEPPARPPAPYASDADRRVLANETAEVAAGQVDFLGPFVVEDSGEALFVKAVGRGAPVEVLVYPTAVTTPWRDALQRGARLTAAPAPALAGFALPPEQPTERKVPLPPGSYTLVLDNSAEIGVVKPPASPLGVLGALGANLGAGKATLTYSVELGDD